jgi:hypothetical protein
MKKQKPLTHSASKHPAKEAKPMRRPDPARDGFSTNSGTALQLERAYAERDCPIEDRKDRA